MDYFGINSPDDLPKLKEVFDETMVNPTIISEEPLEEVLTSFEVKEEAVIAEDVAGFVVSEDGELRLENTDKDDAVSDETSDDNDGSDA
jgi:segregation and condensation protein B